MADNVKRTEAQALAAAIASGFLVPPAAVVIESALLLCGICGERTGMWESFCRREDSPCKNFRRLADFTIQSFKSDGRTGFHAEKQWTWIVLWGLPSGSDIACFKAEKKVMRAMDMIEDAIRKKGRANSLYGFLCCSSGGICGGKSKQEKGISGDTSVLLWMNCWKEVWKDAFTERKTKHLKKSEKKDKKIYERRKVSLSNIYDLLFPQKSRKYFRTNAKEHIGEVSSVKVSSRRTLFTGERLRREVWQ